MKLPEYQRPLPSPTFRSEGSRSTVLCGSQSNHVIGRHAADPDAAKIRRDGKCNAAKKDDFGDDERKSLHPPYHRCGCFWARNFFFRASLKPPALIKKVQYRLLNMLVDIQTSRKGKWPLWGIVGLRGLLINPHIKWSILYLLCWISGLHGCSYEKVACTEASTPMLLIRPTDPSIDWRRAIGKKLKHSK